MKRFTALIEEGEDGYLIGEILEYPGCRSQAKTKKELLERLQEALSLFVNPF